MNPAPPVTIACGALMRGNLSRCAANRTRRAQRLAPFDLTYPKYLVLLALHEENGQTVGMLGKRLTLDFGTLSPLLKDLEKSGYVTRQVDPEDRRSFRIALTLRGKRAFERVAAEHERWVVDLFEDLTVKQKTLLADLLMSLKTSAKQHLMAESEPRA